jgi:signal transduction histidine kinase/FixJ family two-component response regulator
MTWKRLAFTVLVTLLAALLRIWPMQILGAGVPWLTFFAAVLLSAVYGGFLCGLISAILSCVEVNLIWPLIAAQPFLAQTSDWVGMFFFFAVSVMLSYFAESLHRARRFALEAQEKAQAANEAKSRFLANMSHDLRTPLNAILGYSQLLRRDASLDMEKQDSLRAINRNGQYLLTLLNDMLDISKIETKGITQTLENFDMHQLIYDISSNFQLRADTKNLQFEVKGVEQVPHYIISDQTKLRSALNNLISNAIKFTEHGGVEVRFSAREETPGKVILSVDVEDTGAGIAREEMGKLFKFFSQTQSGLASGTGTGLGLAISQEYAKLMGGEITVESAQGEGSCFHLEIAVRRGEVISVHPDRAAKTVIGFEPLADTPRILIAEDTPDSRILLVKLLRSVGFDVQEAHDGREAVEIAEKWMPDLIWMDIIMPLMNGLEATARIRATPKGEQIKIIALPAHVFDEERASFFTAGFDDIVLKPYREHEIFDTMAKHLGIIYIYREEHADAPAMKHAPEVRRQALGGLPADRVAALYEAVLELDTERILSEIAEIEKIDGSAGLALKDLAEHMDYSTLLDITRSSVKGD